MKTQPTKLDDFNISAHWLPALINGDYSNLSDSEELQINEWQDEIRDDHAILFGEIPEGTEFTSDAISGLMADCYLVRVYLETPYNEIAQDIANTPFAWPGGYERFAITDDGGVLCHKCCISESILINSAYPNDGWNVIGSSASCEVDGYLACDHCNRTIQEASEY